MPVSAQELAATTEINASAPMTPAEHVIELNAGGANNEVIAWDDWWTMKEETN